MQCQLSTIGAVQWRSYEFSRGHAQLRNLEAMREFLDHILATSVHAVFRFIEKSRTKISRTFLYAHCT